MAMQGGGITSYLELDTSKFSQRLSTSEGQLNSFGNKVTKLGSGMQSVGKKMTKGLTVPILAIGAGALKVGMEFESGMSEVSALSGATGADLEMLEAKAREMGSTTKYSASESAEALKYMSLAGWDAEQMAAGLEPSLKLAGAAGMELGTATDIVTDTMSMFGMEANEAAKMTDMLAYAQANSNTDVEGLGEALKYAGASANAMGYDLADTTALLGAFADQGLKGSAAGTTLNAMFRDMKKNSKNNAIQIGKTNIAIEDSNGNYRDMAEIMADVEIATKDMTMAEKDAALSKIWGTQAIKGVNMVLEAGTDKLKDFEEGIRDSDGAASDMYDTMQDNLKGSIDNIKSALEEAGISMSESLIPMAEKGATKIQALADSFNGLDTEQKENIVKWGLILTAAGPVLTLASKLTSGIGLLAGGVGKLSIAMGAAQGAGLLGSLAALGPLAVGGIAVAGIVALNNTINDYQEDALKLEEHNLDLTQSMVDQEVQLRESTEVFEQLTAKAELTNRELAELDDLNKRISQSSNPGEIEQLKEAYKKLAEKSGLSKDELTRLFEANEFLIEQVPHVEQAISNEGNAFVISTEKVREYTQALNDMTSFEMEMERQKLLDNEAATREKLTEEIKTQNKYQEMSRDFMEAQNLELGEMDGRLKDIEKTRKEINYKGQEDKLLLAERNMLLAIQNGDEELANEYRQEGYEIAQRINQEQSEKVQSLQEELDKLDVIEQKLINQELARVGITEEGVKGLEQLDSTIAKNQEELDILNEKLNSAEGLTEEEKNRMKHLLENNAELETTKQLLYDEYGLYKNINSLATDKIKALGEEGRLKIDNLARTVGIFDAEDDILGKLHEQNDALKDEKKQLKINRKEKGANKKEIDKQIQALDTKLGKQAAVERQILIELGIWDEVDQSIRDGIEAEILKGNAVDGTKTKLDSQGNSIDGNNEKTKEGIRLERDRSEEAGKDVDKKVTVDDYGTVAIINKAAEEKKKKEVQLQESGLEAMNLRISRPISKVVNFIGKGLKGIFADGTPPKGHVGGLAMVGDGGGEELITLPSGKAFLSPATDTILDLPKGTHVASHEDTKRMLKSIPKYASGTGRGIAGTPMQMAMTRSTSIGNRPRLDMEKANRELLELQEKANAERIKNEAKATKDMMDIAKRLNAEKMYENKQLDKKIQELEIKSHEEIRLIRAKAADDKRGLTKSENEKITQIRRAANRDMAELEKEKTTSLLRVMERENAKVVKLEKELQDKLDFYARRAQNNNRDITAKEKKEILKLTESYNVKIALAEVKALEDRNRVIQENSEEFLKNSKEFADMRKRQGLMSIKEEIAYWDRISRTVLSHSKEYTKALEYKQDALQKINSQMVMANEDYAEKIRNIDQKILEDTKRLNQEYESALVSRRKELSNFTGLFNKFTESNAISSTDLIANMKSQVDALQDYEINMLDLGARVNNEDLMDELKALGPAAIGQIKSLNSMSSSELAKFVSLYEDKFRLASSQAEKELEPMKGSIELQIQEMKKSGSKELEILEKEWLFSIREIVGKTGDSLVGLEDVGGRAIEGLELGMLSKENQLMDTASRIAENVKSEIAKAFDIHSPSRWAKNYIGMNIGEGWIEGMDAQENSIISKAAEMAEWMKPDNFKVGGSSRSLSGGAELDYEKLADAFVKGLKNEGFTKPANIYLDKRKVGKGLVDIISSEMNGKSANNDRGRGVPIW